MKTDKSVEKQYHKKFFLQKKRNRKAIWIPRTLCCRLQSKLTLKRVCADLLSLGEYILSLSSHFADFA